MSLPTLTLPPVDQAIKVLSGHPEEYAALLEFIRESREGYISHFTNAPDPHRTMSLAGAVGACDYMLTQLRTQ